MEFITACFSKPGCYSINEDCCGFLQLNGYGCWVVADGLGGHGGGEVASTIAVEKIKESFKAVPAFSETAVLHYLETAQAALIQQQDGQPELSSMRTTIVLLLTDFKSTIWAHAGDSRLYYFRSGRIEFQTKDHSVPQALADAGVITTGELRHHEDRNRLLRVLGKKGDLRPVMGRFKHPVQNGDAFLLCTDGFWEGVTETEMEVELAKSESPSVWLARMETRILERAKKEQDNYSAIAIFAE